MLSITISLCHHSA